MADYDAAAALLLLSSGGLSPQAIDSEKNNNRRSEGATKENIIPTGPMHTRGSTNRAAAGQKETPTMMSSLRQQNALQCKVIAPEVNLPATPLLTVKRTGLYTPDREAAIVKKTRYRPILPKREQPTLLREHDSPEQLLGRWDDSRTSSPIIPAIAAIGQSTIPSGHDRNDGSGSDGELERLVHKKVYASPGMHGFAMQLNAGTENRYEVSSPEPLMITRSMKAETTAIDSSSISEINTPYDDEGDGASAAATASVPAAVVAVTTGSHSELNFRPVRNSIGIGMVKAEEKAQLSPSDSGNSSIHDEILQSGLIIQAWTRGSDISTGLPENVKIELHNILQTSLYNKECYTKEKMAEFPMDVGYHPNKSRLRKEYSNDAEAADRAKNNLASRRSRHKKKMVTQLMNISLEYDRQENRELFLQERWLTNFIFELEDKALQQGIDTQVLRKLRADCGFQ
ncbi:uncharacterized protein LOC118468741 [Anopheles albimanus]|uniref:BZIP1 n=1 Tax=Anopheles albimanus TaxID=7167 RepID=H9NAC6_ANOAL|nr:uncharacterized protein LOC118468741 [Anopheles albimanus]AFF19517.1 bZIP1 [Anopheles albimanus]